MGIGVLIFAAENEGGSNQRRLISSKARCPVNCVLGEVQVDIL